MLVISQSYPNEVLKRANKECDQGGLFESLPWIKSYQIIFTASEPVKNQVSIHLYVPFVDLALRLIDRPLSGQGRPSLPPRATEVEQNASLRRFDCSWKFGKLQLEFIVGM